MLLYHECRRKSIEKRVFSKKIIDISLNIIYNYCKELRGAVRVSTGILRHDKRGGQDNPVKLSNLKNKRQQYCCSCSVSCDAALTPPVPRERTTTLAVRQMSSEHAPRFRTCIGHAQKCYLLTSLSIGA